MTEERAGVELCSRPYKAAIAARAVTSVEVNRVVDFVADRVCR